MKIGVDLSPLQSGSRMRGIGYSLINILNNLDADARKNNSFVFYIEKGLDNPINLINTKNLSYRIEYLIGFKSMRNFPSKLRILSKLINKFRLGMHQWIGSKRFKNVNDIDVFFQVDQSSGLPSKRRVNSVLLMFDIIPIIMEREYIWSYTTARQHGLTRKGALGSALDRFTYYMKVKAVVRRSHKLVTSSQWSKNDYVKYLKVKPDNIAVCELGVNKSHTIDSSKQAPIIEKSVHSSWGYLKEPVDLTKKPFLLFIGGADPRRRLIDLVAAYNNLKAQNHDIRLVFTGDSMQNPETIANPILQDYIKRSTSYTDDLIFAGFVSDEQREWLYANALAFVFPSVYEGFGLPVLEAMEKGCPVISYINTSIQEIAGDAVLKASNYEDIMKHTLDLMKDNDLREQLIEAGRSQAAKFTWKKTSKDIMQYLADSSY